MKSCLKHSTSAPHALYQPPTPPPDSPARQTGEDMQSKDEKRKSVSFSDDGEVQVFYVEDWDRSPAAVVERLTYKDVYELKEMQMALPRMHLSSEHRMKPLAATANAS